MFWDIFYKVCIEQGTKPNPVAKQIGVSSSTVTSWKNGGIPNGETLLKLANYLNVSVDYLLGRTDNPNSVTQVNTGDVGNHSNVNINAPNKTEFDETTNQVAEAFSNLDFLDKAKVMNLIAELSEKGKDKKENFITKSSNNKKTKLNPEFFSNLIKKDFHVNEYITPRLLNNANVIFKTTRSAIIYSILMILLTIISLISLFEMNFSMYIGTSVITSFIACIINMLSRYKNQSAIIIGFLFGRALIYMAMLLSIIFNFHCMTILPTLLLIDIITVIFNNALFSIEKILDNDKK